MVGTLERTKTSGPGKKAEVLPVFVSDKAWLDTPWLDAAFVLWLEGDLAFARDYFLPLPTEDLSGALRRRALYSDSAALSASLLDSLENVHGKHFFRGPRAAFGPNTRTEQAWTLGPAPWGSSRASGTS